MMKILPLSFYDRPDVIEIARQLLGKIVVTNIGDKKTSGRIVETEAYVAIVDKASHSFGGRRTPKNEHMYDGPGTAYIYICYGLHQMLNVVTNKPGIPDAVLIRAIEPLSGTDLMLHRRKKKKLDFTLTRGPGNVGKALGVNTTMSGDSLRENRITLYEDGFFPGEEQLGISPRIGVDGAGEDAKLLYRFYIRGNQYVSGRRS